MPELMDKNDASQNEKKRQNKNRRFPKIAATDRMNSMSNPEFI